MNTLPALFREYIRCNQRVEGGTRGGYPQRAYLSQRQLQRVAEDVKRYLIVMTIPMWNQE